MVQIRNPTEHEERKKIFINIYIYIYMSLGSNLGQKKNLVLEADYVKICSGELV